MTPKTEEFINQKKRINYASKWRKTSGPRNKRISTTKMAFWCNGHISIGLPRRLSGISFMRKCSTYRITRLWMGTQEQDVCRTRWGRICIGHIWGTMYMPQSKILAHALKREELNKRIKIKFACSSPVEHCNLLRWTSWGPCQKLNKDNSSWWLSPIGIQNLQEGSGPRRQRRRTLRHYSLKTGYSRIEFLS